MKKIILYLLLFLSCAQKVSAQKNESWENAVVILQNGDSLTGKVLYRNEADIYTGFTFEDSAKLTRQFKAADIHFLVLPDYKVQYDQITFKTKKDSFIILASPIVKGTASLYQSQIDPEKFGLNDAQEPFFIIKSPKGVFPLLHNQNPNQIEYNKFKGILNYVTGECNDQEQIKRLKYTSNDIASIILAYNKCKDPNAVPSEIYTKTHIPAIVSHQVTVGGVLASRKVEGQWYRGVYYERPFNAGFGFNLGYSLQVVYPSISKRISTEFGIGAIYAKYQAIPVNRYLISDHYFAGRFKIIAGYALSNEAAIKPVIQGGPSLEFTTDIFSISPLLNLGFGLNMKRYFVGGLVEFPFSSFSNRSFYSLNFKYTFARSVNKKQK